MHIKRRNRLISIFVLIGLSSLALFLILNALKENINLFFTPTEVVEGKVPADVRIRVGGMVEKGSVERKEDLIVEFKITDYRRSLSVHYQGILPDLFKEGQGIVIMGRWAGGETGNTFEADEVLAKHDENYMPSEAKAALKAGKGYPPHPNPLPQGGEGTGRTLPQGREGTGPGGHSP